MTDRLSTFVRAQWLNIFPYISFVFRYLRSLVETILIYQQFKKPGADQPAPKQELMDFWMDFLVEATKKDVSSVRFPVSLPGQSTEPLIMYVHIVFGG